MGSKGVKKIELSKEELDLLKVSLSEWQRWRVSFLSDLSPHIGRDESYHEKQKKIDTLIGRINEL